MQKKNCAYHNEANLHHINTFSAQDFLCHSNKAPSLSIFIFFSTKHRN